MLCTTDIDTDNLLERLRRGDSKEKKQAFEELVWKGKSRYKRLILNLISKKIPPQDVDDVLQNTILEIWTAIPNFKGEGASLESYIEKIARFTIVKYFRRRRETVSIYQKIGQNDKGEPIALESILKSPAKEIPENKIVHELMYRKLVEYLKNKKNPQVKVSIMLEILNEGYGSSSEGYSNEEAAGRYAEITGCPCSKQQVSNFKADAAGAAKKLRYDEFYNKGYRYTN